MNSLTHRLDQLESRLQTLIEGKLARLLPLQAPQDELAHRLVVAMQAGALLQRDGTTLAPDHFQVLVHPSQAQMLADNQPLLLELAGIINEAGTEAGLQFVAPPVIEVTTSEETNPKEVTILARVSRNFLEETSALEIEAIPESAAAPKDAFLIIDGVGVFDLDLPVTNIGRSKDNHLVIDDSRVSRQHAQIRVTRGNYYIFDLDSTGGTFINQRRISQSILHPGDVISLAGVTLIYGNEASQAMGDTREILLPSLSLEDTDG
jgi:hypothetical protein